MLSTPTHHFYVPILTVVFLTEWIALAINPLHRDDWLLENILVFLIVPILAITYRRFPFSKVSYTLLFIFGCLHVLGAHYTYAEVPYDFWWNSFTGRSLNEVLDWQRNNFDRIVHFTYGLLLAYPIREVYLRIAGVRGFWGYALPLSFIMSTSMIFELVEWGAATVFGGNLGMAYLGTQGDEWDAHKDMALASFGAVITMISTAMLNMYLQRDFAQEWAESLRIKQPIPLGEQEIQRLWNLRQK
jgi:putative membrane protein